MFRLFKKVKYVQKQPNKYGISSSRSIYLPAVKRVESKNPTDIPGSVKSRYEAFVDKRSPLVLDLEEERLKIREEGQLEKDDDFNPYEGISPERGTTGVIEVHEVVEILKQERGKDIFVVSIPPKYKYVDYVVLVTAKSPRHMIAIGEFMRRVYKYKRHTSDLIPTIEGAKSKDWIALDLGNIVLHIFSKSARMLYDLETLWTVGKDYDDQIQRHDHNSLMSALQKHSAYMGTLTPADT